MVITNWGGQDDTSTYFNYSNFYKEKSDVVVEEEDAKKLSQRNLEAARKENLKREQRQMRRMLK